MEAGTKILGIFAASAPSDEQARHPSCTRGDTSMKRKLVATLAVGLLAGPMVADAAEVQSDTSVLVTFRDCISNGITACDALSSPVAQSYDGDPGDLAATASIKDSQYGESYSGAQLPGVTGAPILNTSALSAANKRVGANSVALQRYTYIGSGTTLRTVSASLAYSQFMPDENLAFPLQASSGISAQLFVFETSTDRIEVGTTPAENFTALFGGQPISAVLTQVLGFDEFVDFNTTEPAGTATLNNFTFQLNPGDTFWVYALLQNVAANGAWGTGTLVTMFDDATDLIPADSVPVPQMLMDLSASVANVGPGPSLANKLRDALAYYAAGDIQATCVTLNAFQNEVQAASGKKIRPTSVADDLISDAQDIMNAMSCN